MAWGEGKKLLRNRAQCNLCKEIIESKHRHDFKHCKCGEIFVDGGTSYERRGARDWKNVIDLCEYADDPQ